MRRIPSLPERLLYTPTARFIRNCYSPEDHKVIDDAFIKTTLGWEDADWKFNGDGTPDINREEAQKTYDITVMIGNTEVTKLTVENMYVPMTYWYALALTSEDGEGLNEFIGSGKNRTYGYYFDAELTQRVPNGFIPTRAVTLYAAYVRLYGSYRRLLYRRNGRFVLYA